MAETRLCVDDLVAPLFVREGSEAPIVIASMPGEVQHSVDSLVVEANRLTVHSSPAHADGSWISLCSPDSVQPLQAIATAVDPHIEVRVSGTGTDWTAGFTETDATAGELPEVEVVKFSGGASFQFEPRRSLPLTVV